MPGRARRRGERGAFLTQAVVFVLLLALLASLAIRLTYARHVFVHKARSGASARAAAEAAEAYALACLANTAFGRDHCSLASITCLPASVAGRSLRWSASGSPPQCRLETQVGD
ncbi:MAG: hypothetical protein HYZ75_13665 [Elusimicrobia bacterium]|nr:hypothetical protein [Elusimicrobiota bacterium]